MKMNWKKTIAWTAAGLSALLALVVVAGYFYLRSNSFQQFALRKILQEANTATGARTAIGRLDFDLSTLTATFYDVTLHGTEASDQPPLLHLDKLTVRLKIVSAFHHEVSLQELLIDHPSAHILVTRDGKNNLPTPPPSQGSHTSVFDLAIAHTQVNNGEINYNDRKTPLEADLRNLHTEIHFERAARRYAGNLSYDNGRLRYAQYAPFPHNLTAKFSATPDALDLQSATLQVASSEISLQARLSNYANPVADADYRIRIHTQDFATMSPEAVPAGDVTLTGKAHYEAAGTQSALRNVSLTGDLSSDLVSIAVSKRPKVEVRKLRGNYQLAGGNLTLTNITLDSLGGRITASGEMKHLDVTPESNVQASLEGISLGLLQRMLGNPKVHGVTVAGAVRGRAEASWKGSPSNLRARSDLAVQAVASNTASTDVPVNGEIHATYDGPRNTIELRDTTLKIPAATLTAQGTVGNHSNLQVRAETNDLRQLVSLAYSLSPGESAPPNVSGAATLTANIRGSTKKPAIDAQLSAENLQVENSQWKTLSLALRANPSEITVDNGLLVHDQHGRATFTADVALRNWAYSPSAAIRAHLDVQQMNVSDLLQLAKQDYPVSGELSANVTLQGSQLQPAGSGTVQITKCEAYGEPIHSLNVKFHGENGEVVSTLNVSAPAGAINADLNFTPQSKAYKIRLDAPSIALEKLHTLEQREIAVNGTASLSVNGQGTIDDPQLDATLQLPELHVRQNSISAVKAEVRVAQHRADFDLAANVSPATVHAHGSINLTGNYDVDAAIDTGTIPLEMLAATYAPSVSKDFQGQTEFHATVKGPLKDKSALEAHLSIPVFHATYQSLEIGIAEPIRIDYANSVAILQPTEIRGTNTSLQAQGRFPLTGSGVPTLGAQGSVDLRILQILSPGVKSSGKLTFNVATSGSATNPLVQGQVQLQNVSVLTPDSPLGLDKLNGTLAITGDHLQVSNLTAQVGGGDVSVGGSITYRPSVQFSLAVQGKSVRLRYPEGLRTLLDANLAFNGTPKAFTLNGRVLIDSLSFTSDFDLTKFANQFSTINIPTQPGFADTIKLAINLQSQQDLNARSSQISIGGQVALHVGGTAADPVITGRTVLTSGELFYRNVRYQLERGIITFDNPTATTPTLNIAVTTTVEQYNLTLTLRGPLDQLSTSYVSDPPLATADVINLIARGQTTEEQSANSQSTDSMIASGVAGQLTNGVQNLVGLSSLSIDPTLGGSNTNPSARIAIQQRVTKNLLFSFSTDVSEPGTETIQGEYQINKRWSVSVARDESGGVSVDGRYHTKF